MPDLVVRYDLLHELERALWCIPDPRRVRVSRCLREQERVRDSGRRLAADEDLPQRDAEEDPSEHPGRVLPPRSQTLSTHASSVSLPAASIRTYSKVLWCCYRPDTRDIHVALKSLILLKQPETRRGRYETYAEVCVYSVDEDKEEGVCVCVPSVCDDGVMIVSCFSLPKETTRSPKSEENDSHNFCRQPSDQKAMKHF